MPEANKSSSAPTFRWICLQQKGNKYSTERKQTFNEKETKIQRKGNKYSTKAQKMSLLDKKNQNLLLWQLKTLSVPHQHLNRGITILFKIQIAFNFAEKKVICQTTFEAEKAPGMSQSLPDQSRKGFQSLWAVLAWVEVDCVLS